MFSDDWGRHPSSSQHLVRCLLEDFDVDWVNTIGTRRPGLSLRDLYRGLEKLRKWGAPHLDEQLPKGLRVHAPIMWPSFGRTLGRRLNKHLLSRALRQVLGGTHPPVAVISTLPIMADLARKTSHLRWIYYSVDALSEWPGLDGKTIRAMELDMVEVIDFAFASAPVLVDWLKQNDVQVQLLTHGVDLDLWRLPSRTDTTSIRPRVLFFGLVDSRLDERICLALADETEFHLIGPQDNASKALLRHPNVHLTEPVPIADLAMHASNADVLVMPYRHCALTRAMQPLKLKEYLATGLPTISTKLPAVIEWREALDMADTPEDFVRLVHERAGAPLPEAQAAARLRLADESWKAKAQTLAAHIRTNKKAEMPTVLHVRAIHARGGGPEKTILASRSGLEAHGFNVLAAYLHDPSDPDFRDFQAAALEAGALLIPVPDHGPLDWHLLPEIVRICRQHRVRIWHGHDYKSNLLGLAVRRTMGVHLVSTVHGWVQRTSRTLIYFALDRWALRRYDRVLAVSSELYGECLEFGVPSDRLRLVHNAINPQSLSPGSRDRGPGDELVIGAVGRLAQEKGLGTLLQVIHELVQEGCNIKLEIAGDGELDAWLRDRIDSLELDARINLLGFVTDRASLFERFDIFVSSSIREGLPNTLLEAMAAGLPIVATSVGGVAEAVSHEREALLCKRDDPDSLREALRRMYLDADLRKALGNAARRRVIEAFTFEERMNHVAAVYDELIQPV